MDMARIRTVKPELFRHEGLYDLEASTRLPIRIAWIGLLTVADREGRFKWQPNILKLDILPWDQVDFEQVLIALNAAGFIRDYKVDNKLYGYIPNFTLHQNVKVDEAKSRIPAPPKVLDSRVLPQTHKFKFKPQREMALSEAIMSDESDTDSDPIGVESDSKATQIGVVELEKEKEKELEKEKNTGRGSKKTEPNNKDSPGGSNSSPTTDVWRSYKNAYELRYGRDSATWNAKVGGQLSHFITRVPKNEAPLIAEFYLKHNGSYYVQSGHPVGLLVRDAEKLRTEWLTGRKITFVGARKAETYDANKDAVRAYLTREGAAHDGS
jgi:hypothetical protein